MNLADTFRDKKVLITGGIGFIGSNLARRLLLLKAHVVLVDSLIPEYGGNLKNIEGLDGDLKVNIADVRDEYSMDYLVRGMDYLFNLAGQTSHEDSMTNPQTDLEINAKAQLSILEACRKFNQSIKIVFASTRQIYGKPKYLPVDEKHPLQPADVNGINKIAGEQYHTLYHNIYGIRTCSLRLTNTYGPRMRVKDARQTFVGIWIRNLLSKKPILVYGDGRQLRDFTYVDDAVTAFLLAASSEAANGGVFNIGGLGSISLLELAKMMVEINKEGKYQIVPFPAERKIIDIGDYYADDKLFKSVTSWEPNIGIREGLKTTIDYYRQNAEFYF